MKLLLILILSTSSFISCATPVKGPGPSSLSFDKEKILRLINEARSKARTCGTTRMPAVSPLTWNDKLELAAQKHSNEMNQYNYFSHTSRNGANAGERISATGYSWKTYGENIGQGFRSEEEAVAQWLQSPGHCKNIMSPEFKEIGAARKDSYWTQVFGRR